MCCPPCLQELFNGTIMEEKNHGKYRPQHVAIILDGNGRWAKAKGMPRNYGHVQGAKTVEAHL